MMGGEKRSKPICVYSLLKIKQVKLPTHREEYVHNLICSSVGLDEGKANDRLSGLIT
jgi:hypothetical protein